MSNLKILSDTDPDEPGYTGNYLIAEREGLLGLIVNNPGPGGKNEILPFQHRFIKHFTVFYRKKRSLHCFVAENMEGKSGVLVQSGFFSGYIFDNVCPDEEADTLLYIECGSLQGFYDLDEALNYSKADPIFFPSETARIQSLEWFHSKQIQAQNMEGKWAVFSYFLHQQTPFVFEFPLEFSRFGEVIIRGGNGSKPLMLTLSSFYRKYGIS